MTTTRVEILGVDELRKKLALTTPAVANLAVKAALYEEATAILAASQVEVPRVTGTLAGSGAVLPPQKIGSRQEVTIGYGGAAKAYAIVQHERTDFAHPHGGKAKFLEDPANRAVAGMSMRLVFVILRHLERLRA